MKQNLVAGLGEVLWDRFPDGRKLGGAPANFAYHAHALGAAGALVSQVGNDSLGREILDRLQSLGINIDHVSVDAEHPTGVVDVQLDDKGKPTYDIVEDAAWDYLPYTEEIRALAQSTDAVCFGTLCSRNARSRESIRRFLEDMPDHAVRVFDINLRQNYYSEGLVRALLGHANVLKLSDDELPVVSRMLDIAGDVDSQCREFLQAFDLDLIALTRGGDGSVLYDGQNKSEQPAAPGKVKDTVGAGDSFTAALVLGLLRDLPLDKVNSLASRVATYVCGSSGATPELPADFRDELS